MLISSHVALIFCDILMTKIILLNCKIKSEYVYTEMMFTGISNHIKYLQLRFLAYDFSVPAGEDAKHVINIRSYTLKFV